VPTPSVYRFQRRELQTLRVVAILLAGAIIGICMRLVFKRQARPAAVPAGPTILNVSRSGESGVWSSIQEAARHAHPGDTIQVCEDSWEEALVLTGDSGAKVLIEGHAPSGKPVQWRSLPVHQANQPLISLTSSAGLHLQGFILDGQEHLKDLITLSGPCPGLTLEDITLKGFQQNGVVLHNATGTVEQPVTLERLRVAPVRSAQSALSFQANALEINRHIRVRNCRLEGPYQAAVTLSGPMADVEFQHNRIFNAVDGFHYVRAVPPTPMSVSLLGNTLCQIEKVGLHFETAPPADHSRIVIKNNLFARTETLARVDDFQAQPQQTPAQWIWFDEKQQAGAPAAPEYRFFRKTFTLPQAGVLRAMLDVAGDAAFTVWLNGQRIGHADFRYLSSVGRGDFTTATRRVHAFEVARWLTPGTNVLAVEGTNKQGPAAILAQLTISSGGASPIIIASDPTWKGSTQGPKGWQTPTWDDNSWSGVRVVAPYGQGPMDWQNLVWARIVGEHFQDKAGQLFPEPASNFRDQHSHEAFPALQAVAHAFELPTEGDDAVFLRYPRSSPLHQAGAPGTPPVEEEVAPDR
jgi:hypothetical protein